jgi:hypothetical protein
MWNKALIVEARQTATLLNASRRSLSRTPVPDSVEIVLARRSGGAFSSSTAPALKKPDRCHGNDLAVLRGFLGVHRGRQRGWLRPADTTCRTRQQARHEGCITAQSMRPSQCLELHFVEFVCELLIVRRRGRLRRDAPLQATSPAR